MPTGTRTCRATHVEKFEGKTIRTGKGSELDLRFGRARSFEFSVLKCLCAS